MRTSQRFPPLLLLLPALPALLAATPGCVVVLFTDDDPHREERNKILDVETARAPGPWRTTWGTSGGTASGHASASGSSAGSRSSGVGTAQVGAAGLVPGESVREVNGVSLPVGLGVFGSGGKGDESGEPLLGHHHAPAVLLDLDEVAHPGAADASAVRAIDRFLDERGFRPSLPDPPKTKDPGP